MTDDYSSAAVAAPSRTRLVVALLAVVVIFFAGRSIWYQLPTALPAIGQTMGSGSKSPGRSPEFNMSRATISVEQIRRGGPPKDGIPALTDAKFVSSDNAHFLSSNDRVIGVVFDGQAKAYPLKILDYHEIVNDRLGNRQFAVTYCPLCDSSVVFDRKIGGRTHEFGVSGLLFNSNVLLYDRAKQGRPESLWSQMASTAVTGAGSGQPLKRLPLEVTTWNDWAARYPATHVLSADTGYQRDYNRTVYQDYFASPQLIFPVNPRDRRYPAKTPVLGVIGRQTRRAYVLPEFAQYKGGEFQDTIDGQPITLHYDPQHNSLRVERAAEGLEWIYSFWFAWSAFYPETEIYKTK